MTYAIELNHERSRQILERCCASQRAVRLHPKSWSGTGSISGHLLTEEGGAIGIETEEIKSGDYLSLMNIYCHVDIEAEDGHYFFESHIIAVRHHNERMCLTLARPETLLTRQRRHFKRTAVAESSEVHLSHEHSGELLSFVGRLYNLSPDGMALMLSGNDASAVEVGQQWCLCFEIPRDAHCYKLTGEVVRKLPSSTEQDVIIAVRFDLHQDAMELAHLRDFLSERQYAGAFWGESQ